tara:strand:+ start:125 stop:406 length:282 start_codon:yes stop_codon:yes gene_type:complete
MLRKLLLFSGIIALVMLDISTSLETKAEHKNSLINRFCIASLKSKLKLKDKKKLNEISHFTCECFSRKYKSVSSIKISRDYCRNKAAVKYNLQ